MLKIFIKLAQCSGLLILTACAGVSTTRVVDDSTTDDITQALLEANASALEAQKPTLPPADIASALLPSLLGQGSAEQVEPVFDVIASDLDARQFFLGLVKGSGYNVVVHPEVEGKITLDLSDVSVPETIQAVQEIYNFPIKRQGNLYTVMPAGMRTEAFKINYLDIRRGGVSQTRVASGSVSDVGSTGDNNRSATSSIDDNGNTHNQGRESQAGTYIETSGQSDFWGQLQANLELLIGSNEGRKIVVTPQAGIVIVRAMPNEIDIVRNYLQSSELIMRRQVLLEAKILEVTLNDQFQAGINWTALGSIGDDKSLVFSQGSAAFDHVDGLFVPKIPGSTGIPSAASSNGIFGISMDLKDFAGIIDLLETQGTVQVLSSPRISTINNQKAVIKVGKDEFFVTDVTNTVTTGSSGGNAISTPSVELTPFFSGIALDVTPQISDNDEVILHVHPAISEVLEQVRSFDVADQNFTLPLASSTIRESDSIIFAKSEQVVVIGGLIQSITRDDNSATPWASKIPILGNAFKQRAQASKKQELVILIKPRVVNSKTMVDSISGSLTRIRKSHAQFELDN
jgi:MSHA biogenesis protein MshL